MYDTIKLEAKGIREDFPEMAAGLDTSVLTGQDDWVHVFGTAFELATLVERYESGNWLVPLDEAACGHDHLRAQQRYDQYTI